MKLSEKSIKFIEEFVLPKIGWTSINYEEIDEVVEYIEDKYEIPLAQAKECGETIDDELLELAAGVVTEITTDPDW